LFVTLTCCPALHIVDDRKVHAVRNEEGSGSVYPGKYLDCSWSPNDVGIYEQDGEVQNLRCKGKAEFRNGKTTIVCIGDSITEGYPMKGKRSYPARLYSLLHEQFNVLNLGVSGTTGQLGRDHSYWMVPQWETALETKFDVAIVQFGSNDAKTRNWDHSKYRKDYLKMIQQLAQRHPQATILVSVPPLAKSNNLGIQPDVVSKPLPEAIRDVARDAGLRLEPIDLQAAFADAEQSIAAAERLEAKDLIREDGVHPTGAGYAVIANAVAAAVRRALRLPP
jgi:lysophospholipase L1-like esterase